MTHDALYPIYCSIIPRDPFKELRLTLAYNKSDATFGWNGFNNAMMLYFMSSQEKFVHRDHGYPLVDGLSPSVSFSVVETKLLGSPFTKCNNAKNYTQRSCREFNLLKKINEKCGCYPA